MADKGEDISDKEAYENLRKSMNYALVRVRAVFRPFWPFRSARSVGVGAA